jgi:hypothetical protein
MRTSFKMLLFVAMSAWIGWATYPAQAAAPDVKPAPAVSEDAAAAEETPCEEGTPRTGLLAIYDRFNRCDGCGPEWSFTADAVALQRSTTRSQHLFEDANGGAILDSQTFDFPYAAGVQLSAIRHGVCGCDLELGYMQVDSFEADFSNPGTTASMITDSNGAFAAVTDPMARYRSALYSAELNMRRQWLDGVTLFSGFRMVELDDRLNMSGTGVLNSESITLDTNAYNHLYGFQLGADVEVYNYGGPLQINTVCKAGVYQNYASQNIHRVDFGFSDDTLSATRNHAAFMGEAGVVATYALTKRLALRATAEAIWIEGVALAPEQIGASNFGSVAPGSAVVDTSGGVFYYGCGLGIEYRF